MHTLSSYYCVPIYGIHGLVVLNVNDIMASILMVIMLIGVQLWIWLVCFVICFAIWLCGLVWLSIVSAPDADRSGHFFPSFRLLFTGFCHVAVAFFAASSGFEWIRFVLCTLAATSPAVLAPSFCRRYSHYKSQSMRIDFKYAIYSCTINSLRDTHTCAAAYSKLAAATEYGIKSIMCGRNSSIPAHWCELWANYFWICLCI